MTQATDATQTVLSSDHTVVKAVDDVSFNRSSGDLGLVGTWAVINYWPCHCQPLLVNRWPDSLPG